MFILATLAVIAVIAALFIGNVRQSRRDAIVLPDAAQTQTPEQTPADTDEPSLLEVSRENVQRIVRVLRRPQHYHQTYSITRQMSGAVSQATAEIWVSDAQICAVLTSADREKHLLTDGSTLYVWYEGDETARRLSGSAALTMDALIGLPTYEQVGQLPAESITDGEFITDDRYDSGQQIFAAAEEGTTRREFWVSVDYGLLTESILKLDGETVYDAVQTDLEILAAGDELFDDVFTLPDGSAPFA